MGDSGTSCGFRAWLVVVWILLPGLVVAERGDPPVAPPSIGYDAAADCLRGGGCEVTLRAIASDGRDVDFRIVEQPRHGSLTFVRRDLGTATYRYTHDGSSGATDSFRFKFSVGPGRPWGYRKATVAIREKPPRLEVDTDALDFGDVPIGEGAERLFNVTNAGGGILRGRLVVGEPWSVDRDVFTLAGGGSVAVRVVFEPTMADLSQGVIDIETGPEPPARVSLLGTGVYRFTVPAAAAFEQVAGAPPVSLPVVNTSGQPLEVSVRAQDPLVCAGSLTVPPFGAVALEVGVEPVHYARRVARLEIGDGVAVRSLSIRLPPPPALLEWEAGKAPSTILPGQVAMFTLRLRNAGANDAVVELGLQGEGLEPAPGQEARVAVASGESVPVKLAWRAPERLGSLEAGISASHGGLASPLPLCTEVVEPPPVSTGAVADRDSPAEGEVSGPTVLDRSASEQMFRRMPRDILYRVEDEWPRAAAVITWRHDSTDPDIFDVRRLVTRVNQPLARNPFEERMRLSGELPPTTSSQEWLVAGSLPERLDDGRWEIRLPGLPPGYHTVRISTRESKGNALHGKEITFFVGKPTTPSPFRWFGALLIIGCGGYLLRRRLRRLFRHPASGF